MKTIYIFLVGILSIQFSFSQENVEQDSLAYDIDDVVVTATRSKRLVNSLPIATTVITKEEIQEKQMTSLPELLNELTGIRTVVDHGAEGVQMQGIDSDYILILIDGSPMVGRTVGYFDLDRIALQQVEQVEIVKGASSSLYGNEALGGVINIITKKDFTNQNWTISSKYETNRTKDAFAGFGKDWKKNQASINARYKHTNGYDLIGGNDYFSVPSYQNLETNGAFTHQFSEKTNTELQARYFYQDASSIYAKGGNSTYTNEWNADAKLNHHFTSKLKLTADFNITNYKTQQSSSFYDEIYFQPELKTEYNHNSTNQIIGGVGTKQESLDRSYFDQKPKLNTTYAFAQYDGLFLEEKLNIVTGFRFDYHQEYKSRLSPKFSARYQLTPKFALRGSTGSGFKRPDFRQLYLNFANITGGYEVWATQVYKKNAAKLKADGNIVTETENYINSNEILKPESSLNINLGTQIQLKNNIIELNGFYNKIKNLIDAQQIYQISGPNISDDPNISRRVFGYINVDAVNTKGFEFNLKNNSFKNMLVSAGYQYLQTADEQAKEKFDQGSVYIRDPKTLQTIEIKESDYFGLPNRPKHMANLSIRKKLPSINSNTNLRATYRSKYALFDTNGNALIDTYDNFVKGYSILDWGYNYHFTETITFGVGVQNILNQKDAQNISNLPGRLINGNLNLQF